MNKITTNRIFRFIYDKEVILRIPFFIFLLLSILQSHGQDAWTQIPSFTNKNRKLAASFVIGDKAYVGTGLASLPILVLKKDLWQYDPLTGIWTQKADFGGAPRAGAVAFSVGSKGYVGTGTVNWDGDDYTDDFWEYDPVSNSWIQIADFPEGHRGGAVGFSINTKGYMGTGFNAETQDSKKDFWEYDPSTDSWTKKMSFPGTSRSYAIGFTIGSKGYIGTGSSDGVPRNDFYEYDPGTNGWTQKEDLGELGRASAVAFSIGNKGYVGTGSVYDSQCNCYYMVNDFWEFDPQNNIWTQKADYGGTARNESIGFAVNGKGYIGLGTGAFDETDFWEYSPDCEAPENLTATNIKSTSAKVNWNIEPGAETYSVRYRKAGTIPWTKTTTQLNYKKLTGLAPDTQYDWAVKSVCDAVNNVSSDWSATQNFTTKPLRLEDESILNEATIEIYPNPFSSSTAVSFSLSENSVITMEVFDLAGRRIAMLVNNEVKETGDHHIPFDRGQIIGGVYFLKMKRNDETLILKIVIE